MRDTYVPSLCKGPLPSHHTSNGIAGSAAPTTALLSCVAAMLCHSAAQSRTLKACSPCALDSACDAMPSLLAFAQLWRVSQHLQYFAVLHFIGLQQCAFFAGLALSAPFGGMQPLRQQRGLAWACPTCCSPGAHLVHTHAFCIVLSNFNKWFGCHPAVSVLVFCYGVWEKVVTMSLRDRP
jgi:hypothetical protein